MKHRLLLSALVVFTAVTDRAVTQDVNDEALSKDSLFSAGRVLQIEIHLDAKDWRALRISHPILEDENNISITEQGYQYYPGNVTIDGHVFTKVGVRKKGAWGSTSSRRPSLKIKFDEYDKKLRLAGLDMLTLNNDSGNDPTKFQPVLIYGLMRKAGVPAPRCNVAHVVVNGEDLGTYANVESIRKPFIKRHFGSTEGDLYEPQNGADFRTNVPPRIEHKWGDDDDLAHVKEVTEILARAGPVSISEIERRVDLKGFMTFWAAEVLLGLGDGYAENQNNYYLYRSGETRKFVFIPWGADNGFADKGYPKIQVPKSVKATGYLCRRLWELPEIRERYREEMRRLLREVWDEQAILSDLERIIHLQGQPELTGKTKEKHDAVTDFISQRRKVIEAELNAPPVDWPKVPRWNEMVHMATNPPMEIQGSFTAPVVVLEGFPDLTNILGQGSVTFDYKIGGVQQTNFTRFGAIAARATGRDDRTLVRIAASTAAGNLRWNVGFDIDSYALEPGILRINPFTVRVPITQSDPERKNVQGKYARQGTLELTEVSTNLGGRISGRFQLNTTAFKEEGKQ